jgi:hypothetical protein
MNLQERVTALMFEENNRVLSRVRPRYRVVNHDREVLERAGLPQEEEQLRLVEVELEVVGRLPS